MPCKKGKSWDKRIAKTSKTIGEFHIVAKIILALLLELAGIFIQPIQILNIGVLYTIFLIVMGYFMFGPIGLIEFWEILLLPIAAFVPTLFSLGIFQALTNKKVKKRKR